MFLRLSKPDSRFQLASGLLLLTLLADCGGKHFSASPGASGSGAGGSSASAGADDAGSPSAGESGSSDEAGSSGSDEQGGTGGTGGTGTGGTKASAGTGGKAAVGCASCGSGTYCRAATNQCTSCADFSHFQFAAPEALRTLSHTGGSVERFPRSASTGSASTASALLYTEDNLAGRELWYAAVPNSGIGNVIQGSGAILGSDSGPLLAPGFVEKNLFFDRKAANGRRKIMMGNWSAGALSDPTAAAAPINAAGFDDYSFAVAPSAGHAYWMSTRDGAAELLWESVNETPMLPPDVLPLKIKIGSNANCVRLGDDATPWVNLTGTVLLFSAQSMDDTCAPNDSTARDLFAVDLDKAGLPKQAAIALSSLNNTGGRSDETDPSLSADACSIYFASDKGTGDYDLYRATRN